MLVALAFFSCEDIVEVKLDKGDQKLNIDAVIEKGKHPLVIVGQTTAYNNQGPVPKLSGAVVSLVDLHQPDKSYLLTDKKQQGYYTTTEMRGQALHVYQLRVSYAEKTYQAIDTLYPVPQIDSMRIDFANPQDPNRSILIAFTDPAERSNYYRWITVVDDYALLDAGNLTISDDRLFNGNTIQNLVVYNGRFLERMRAGARVQLLQQSMSEQAYQFYRQVQVLANSGGMFSPPPANLPTNFTGGAVGFFRAIDVFASRVFIVEE